MSGRIGVISDTHGLLRPQALAALDGCALILHAGDIGDPQILEALRRLAPLHAVRGNNDHGHWAEALPLALTVEHAGLCIHLLHNVRELALDPLAAGIDVVVYGHSHKPCCEHHGGVLWFNPGSAGPRRFSLPIACGWLWAEGAAAQGEWQPLALD